MNKTILSGIIIVLVVAGVLVFIDNKNQESTVAPSDSSSQTSTTTDDYLASYTNEKHNFTFNYPGRLTIQDDKSNAPDLSFPQQVVAWTELEATYPSSVTGGEQVPHHIYIAEGGVPTAYETMTTFTNGTSTFTVTTGSSDIPQSVREVYETITESFMIQDGETEEITVEQPARIYADFTGYTNEKFGFQIGYPKLLLTQKETEVGGNGALFTAPDSKVSLRARAETNTSSTTVSTLQDTLAGRFGGEPRVEVDGNTVMLRGSAMGGGNLVAKGVVGDTNNSRLLLFYPDDTLPQHTVTGIMNSLETSVN